MLASVLTAAVVGVEAQPVRVEADTASGFPRFVMVGLADSAVRESEGRIRAALRNCGFDFKWDRRITVNLAPAALRKSGASYDLATAVGLLAADGLLPAERLGRLLLVGELALDGTLRPVGGVLPMMVLARRLGLEDAIVPVGNAAEAAAVGGLRVWGARSLPEAVDFAAGKGEPPPLPPPAPAAELPAPDMADVRGQALARRALEIAAAGGHNLLLAGPPGSGKTMLARRLPGLLPPLELDEALEATAIHSAWGAAPRAPAGPPAVPRPPPHDQRRRPRGWRQPAAPGRDQPGPQRRAVPGRAARVPPLGPRDAAPAARRRPVTIARVRGTLRFPARFQLVAAMNPCPCGHLGDPARPCRCTPSQVEAYRGRISGPLLDRLDLHAAVPALTFVEMEAPPAEGSLAIAARAAAARARQAARNPAGTTNSRLSPGALRELARPDAEGRALLRLAMDRLGLTGRAHDRLLRVARTMADLQGSDQVESGHVAEALAFRPLPVDARIPFDPLEKLCLTQA